MPVLQFGDQTRPIGPGVLTVGSAPEAAWRVTGHDLEPIHAVIAPELGGRTVLSPGSPAAVVYVNGTRLAADALYALASGDRIRVGVADLVFRQHARARGAGESAFLYDRHRDRLYKLDAGTTVIGRDVNCGICIQDPEVSRSHAEVSRMSESERPSGGYVVVPKTAVTLRNGDRLLKPTPLQEGDELVVGRTRLRFSWDAPRGSSPVGTSIARPAGAKRAAAFQTTYVSTLEARELIQRRTRRRLLAPAAIAAAVGAVLVIGLAIGFARGSVANVTMTTTGSAAASPVSASGSTRPAR